MSYEHKDAAGPGAQPPVYNDPAPADAAYHQQPQQQPIQPVQYQQESYEQKQPQVEQYHQQHQQQQQQHQQQQYQQQPQQGGSVMPLHALSSSPAPIMCPNCHQRSMTRITPITGNTTHAWALALCCLVCLGCIPYCIGSFKDIEHHCGNCGIKVATWHRSGRTDAHMM